jgi:predicted nucleotidyltransferase
MPDDKLYQSFIILRSVVGSRAYSLAGDGSDTDRRGVYLPPAALHWSLEGVPDRLTDPDSQDTYWELKPFLLLALKATPIVLECLHTPLVEHVTPPAEELLAMRDCFLSKLAYESYRAQAESQLNRLGQDLRKTGEPRWQVAMHLLRGLLSGIAVLQEGRVPVRVEEHRGRLLAVRDGRLSWKEFHAWRNDLMKQLELARADSRLPDQPDHGRAEEFLLKARRSMVARASVA